MTGVRTEHPAHAEEVDRWKLVRSVIESKVKKYLKDVDSKDETGRNDKYKDHAQLVNFTARTKNGLIGAMYRAPTEVMLPLGVEYLEDDATGNGMGIARLSKKVSSEVLQTGRYGLLVDYPRSDTDLTQQQVEQLNLKARINQYIPENIINWNSQYVNGVNKLALVVLREYNSVLKEDGFTWEEQTQYRVLKLEDNTYIQQLYNADGDWVSDYIPTDFNGNSWDEIPFMFVGSADNDSDIDTAPLYDLAMLNIGHLRNSADYEESVHIVGQPTLMVSVAMSNEEFKAYNPNGIILGARTGHNLGQGGSAFLLQAAPNQLADEAMRRKEEQAVMLGARLITPASATETVEAVRIKHSSDTSVLMNVRNNVNAAMEQCITWAMRFMTQAEAEFIFEINTQFFDTKVDPQQLMANIQMYTQGILAKTDVRDYLRKHGILDAKRTDEDIDADVDSIDPFSTGL